MKRFKQFANMYFPLLCLWLGLLQNRIRHHPDSTDHQRILKDPKNRAGDRARWILTDSSLGERFPRLANLVCGELFITFEQVYTRKTC